MTIENREFEASSNYYGTLRPAFADLFPSKVGNVLDVGCGRGEYLRMCRERGASRLVGVELRSDTAALLRAESYVSEVVVGGIDDLSAEPYRAAFDLIVAGFVLEHVPNPWHTLSKLKTMLSEGGHILVSLPNVRFWRVSAGLLFRGQWTYEREGVLDWTHLRFFSHKTMLGLFRDTGLLVEATTSEFSSRAQSLDRLTLGSMRELLAYGYNFRLRLDPDFDHSSSVEAPAL